MKNSGLNIAIAGNPNSGKTTIFNAITGARQRVGNWPGVTVERKTGYINRGENRWNFIDLPGTYSLSAFSQEEIIARNYITDEQPDVVVNIVDASNIERNLYLTTQLIELGCPLVIVLNMMDIAKEKGVEIDIETLSTLLGAPIVPVVGSTGEGVEHILDKIDRVVTHESQKSRKLQINYHRDIEAKIEEIIREIDEVDVSNNHRWTAIKLLENDSEILKRVNIGEQIQNKVKSLRQNIENLFKDNTQAIFSNARYGFIQGAVKECVTIHKIDRVDVSKKIDSVLTNKYLGLPIFALLMWLTFKFTFDVGQYPMAWIDGLVSALGAFLSYILPNGTLLQSLVVDGIVAGVGGIAIFLPNIFILFFVIAILEDSGYMARVAFIMDRVMHTIGLHGKAFIPMMMGFGCNVPAIMGTRILETKRDRILTILLNPFMSCSARLPVYILIAGAFFPNNAGTVIFGMYILGIVLAILSGKLFSYTVLKGISTPFVLELPPYLVPKWSSIFLHTWERGFIFIRKMGGVILIGSIIIWALGAFPQEVTLSKDYDKEISVIQEQINISSNDDLSSKIQELKFKRDAETIEQKWIGKIGNTIEPVIRPLGFTWREGVALLTGFIAKEVVVSTYGVLFGVGNEADETNLGIRESLLRSGMTPLIAFGFLIFTLIYTPCLATIVAIKRETQSWKWASFSVIYSLALAWILAFLIYQIGSAIV